jgi:succinyl-CoA synthetase beta subunit
VTQLTEHLSKTLLSPYGIPVGSYQVVTTAPGAAEAAANYRMPVAVKAQIPANSRGKAGLVLRADSPAAAASAFATVTSIQVDGLRASEAIIEPWLDVVREAYLAVTFNPRTQEPVLLYSRIGGTDVEAHGGHIRSVSLPANPHVSSQLVKDLAMASGIRPLAEEGVAKVASALIQAFYGLEARTIEVNPLALVSEEGREWVALDAKIVVDPNALFSHEELRTVMRSMSTRPIEDVTREATRLEFVPLGGPVGVISGGAGMTMAVMDMIADFGSSAACFLDCSADVTPRGYRAALNLVSQLAGVRSVLVSVFGGLTRVDRVAQTFVDLLSEMRLSVPVVFRLMGTNQILASDILTQAGFVNYTVLEDAVRHAVEAARLIGEGVS